MRTTRPYPQRSRRTRRSLQGSRRRSGICRTLGRGHAQGRGGCFGPWVQYTVNSYELMIVIRAHRSPRQEYSMSFSVMRFRKELYVPIERSGASISSELSEGWMERKSLRFQSCFRHAIVSRKPIVMRIASRCPEWGDGGRRLATRSPGSLARLRILPGQGLLDGSCRPL